MAAHIAVIAEARPAGDRIGVVGNTQAHADTLVALVQDIAAKRDMHINHVTLVPIDGSALAKEHKGH
jgi:hypothetical protein